MEYRRFSHTKTQHNSLFVSLSEGQSDLNRYEPTPGFNPFKRTLPQRRKHADAASDDVTGDDRKASSSRRKRAPQRDARFASDVILLIRPYFKREKCKIISLNGACESSYVDTGYITVFVLQTRAGRIEISAPRLRAPRRRRAAHGRSGGAEHRWSPSRRASRTRVRAQR